MSPASKEMAGIVWGWCWIELYTCEEMANCVDLIEVIYNNLNKRL